MEGERRGIFADRKDPAAWFGTGTRLMPDAPENGMVGLPRKVSPREPGAFFNPRTPKHNQWGV